MNNIAAKLRERHWRAGTETNDEARVRRQREREEGAAEIERLTARVEDLVRVLKLADDALGEDANAQVRLEVSGYIRAAITQEKRDE